MKRVITYEIDTEQANQTILQFLKNKLYTDKAIIALKKTPEGILRNGIWAYVNENLSSGDILTINLVEESVSDNIVPEKLNIDIVYEDEDILVINKPYDMPIHPSQNHYTGTLANALAYCFKEQGKEFVFRCVNRLDKDTSGLTIVCKNQLAGGILSDMVSRREIKRTYLAICEDDGTLSDEGTIDAPIARKEGSTIERMVDYTHGERAVTHYKVLERNLGKGLSLIQLELETGRTHQIRVHMSYIGHPLIGDGLYGNQDSKANKFIDRQALHSYSLEFIHPVTMKKVNLLQEIPDDMYNIIKE